jgi:hypothetical protein
VQTISGYVDTKAASFRMCDGIRVPYTIDIYINAANLADYGVRNFNELAATMACGGRIASGQPRQGSAPPDLGRAQARVQPQPARGGHPDLGRCRKST